MKRMIGNLANLSGIKVCAIVFTALMLISFVIVFSGCFLSDWNKQILKCEVERSEPDKHFEPQGYSFTLDTNKLFIKDFAIVGDNIFLIERSLAGRNSAVSDNLYAFDMNGNFAYSFSMPDKVKRKLGGRYELPEYRGFHAKNDDTLVLYLQTHLGLGHHDIGFSEVFFRDLDGDGKLEYDYHNPVWIGNNEYVYDWQDYRIYAASNGFDVEGKTYVQFTGENFCRHEDDVIHVNLDPERWAHGCAFYHIGSRTLYSIENTGPKSTEHKFYTYKLIRDN